MVLFCIWCNSNKITNMCLFLCFFFFFNLTSSTQDGIGGEVLISFPHPSKGEEESYVALTNLLVLCILKPI